MRNEKTNKGRKNKKTGRVILVLSIILLLAIAVVALLVHLNRFALRIELVGDAEIQLEYQEEYKEQGAKALFGGTLFMKEPISCEVEIKGDVDTGKLGSYTVEYLTSYTLDYFIAEKKFTEKAVRTVNVVDTQPPVIELNRIEGHYTLPGHSYEEEGFSVTDNHDKDLTASVTVKEEGGRVYYSVADSSGNKGEAVRDIFYDDPVPPELKLMGDWDIVITEGGSFFDPGYRAYDNVDGDLTDAVKVSGEVNTKKAGSYTVSYTVTDGYENTTTLTRPVTVKARSTPGEDDVLYGKPLNPNGKVVYLTFDDGPGKHTERLLDLLDKYGIKATFFVVNTSYLDILPDMVKRGHTVAMHTSTHDYETIYASDEAYFEDLAAIENRIIELTGSAPKILRFPGGTSNLISRDTPGIMSRISARVKELGYRYFDWNVDSNDAGGTKTAEGVYKNVVDYLPKYNCSVVLQHDIYGYSVDAVERIIVWGLENGYTFLPLSENSPVCEHNPKN